MDVAQNARIQVRVLRMRNKTRSLAAALAVALAIAGAATAAVVGSGNPTGQWATPEAIQAALLSHGVDIDVCAAGPPQPTFRPDGVCKVGRPAQALGMNGDRVTSVRSATVTGIDPSKLANGVPRYQLFNVRACTIYYYKGAHRFGVHFRWYTRRPPSNATITEDLGRSRGPDDGRPYAKDWNYPRFGPLASAHC